MLHTRIFQFNPLGTNCMVTWADGSRTCTVVDPGMSSDEGEKELLGFLASEGIVPDAILLTHGHFDHVWGVERLMAKYPVPVYMHPADGGILRDGASAFRGTRLLPAAPPGRSCTPPAIRPAAWGITRPRTVC